jgi:hypothetical protein
MYEALAIAESASHLPNGMYEIVYGDVAGDCPMQMLCHLSGYVFGGGCNGNYSDGGDFEWVKQVWMVAEYR